MLLSACSKWEQNGFKPVLSPLYPGLLCIPSHNLLVSLGLPRSYQGGLSCPRAPVVPGTSLLRPAGVPPAVPWHTQSGRPPQGLPGKQPNGHFLAPCHKRALLQMDLDLLGPCLAALVVLAIEKGPEHR